jgi:hypothetical protein
LNERDDVSRIYICSRHFKLPGNLVALKRLPPGTVPTIEVPVQNHSVELRNVSTNTENTLKSVVNFTTPTVSNVMERNNTIQSISEPLTYHSCKSNINHVEIKICIHIIRKNNVNIILFVINILYFQILKKTFLLLQKKGCLQTLDIFQKLILVTLVHLKERED